MHISDLRTLYDYYYWATARILDSASHLTHDQFAGPALVGERSVRAILVHAMSTERRWRTALKDGVRVPHLQEDEFPDVTTLTARWQSEEHETRAYLTNLTDEDLHVGFVAFNGLPVWQVLMHIANHGMQHRSEAALLLSAYRQSPGDLDLIFFLHDQLSHPPDAETRETTR